MNSINCIFKYWHDVCNTTDERQFWINHIYILDLGFIILYLHGGFKSHPKFKILNTSAKFPCFTADYNFYIIFVFLLLDVFDYINIILML